MDAKSFAQKNQFDYLYDAIVTKYPHLKIADSHTAFQFMSEPMQADWITGTDEKAYNFADIVPARTGGFYVPGASRVSIAYESLLQSLMGTLGDSNTKYREHQEKMKVQLNLIAVAMNNAKQAYGMWRTEQYEMGETKIDGFSDWLNKNAEAYSYKGAVDQVTSEYERYSSEAESIYKGMGAALSIARKNLDTDQMLIAADVKGGKYVPRTTIGGNLQGDIARWQKNADQYDFDVMIKNDEREIKPWQTVSRTEVKQTCHSTQLNSVVDVSRIVMDRSYQLRVKAVGLQGYGITRGSWYNDTFVHPEMRLPEGCQLDTKSFFGEDGSLHMIPTSLLVLYRPEIELTISTQCYRDTIANKTFADIPYLFLFGMRFDMRASLELGKKESSDTVTQTFIAPANQTAQVLGMTSIVRCSGYQAQ